MQAASAASVISAAVLLASGGVFAQTLSEDEVRAIVAEMTSQSQARTSLMAGADGGHDGKFFLAGEGFRLNVSGQVQFRYIANFRDEDDSDDFDGGFQTRRTKLAFEGEVNDDWGFEIVGAFDRDGGSFDLEDAYVTHELSEDMEVKMGQFKLPFMREELVSSKRQLAVDRSVVNEIFNQDRSQGIEFGYSDEQWNAKFAFSDGFNSDNTDFNSAGEADWAFTGRAEYLAQGEGWKRFSDFTSKQGEDFAMMFGIAGHVQQMTVGKGSQTNDPADTDVDLFAYTFDASVEGDGWNAFGAFVGRHVEAKSLAGDSEFDDFGVVLQGGYRVQENTELFGRWDGAFIDEDRGGDEDTFNFLTFGVNQYYASHAAKATIDVVVALEETTDLSGIGGFPNDGVGLLGSGEDTELAFRFQFQLLF